MALVNEINQIYQNFTDIIISLKEILTSGQKSLQDEIQSHTSLLTKLKEYTIQHEDEANQANKNLVGLTVEEAKKSFSILTEHSKFYFLKPGILSSMSFIYLVAVFEAFMTDIFTAVLKHNPEMLKNEKKQLSHEEIIDLHLSGELIPYLAQIEMDVINDRNIKKQAENIKKTFKLDLAESGVSIDELSEIMAIRNVLVHKNGVVDAKFLRIVKNSPYKPGDKIQIAEEYWKVSWEKLYEVVVHTHNKIIEKYCR